MDPYGIASVLHVALELHEIQSRGTGRTTKLMREVKPGDLVVVSSVNETRHLRLLMRERGWAEKDTHFAILDDDVEKAQDDVDRWLRRRLNSEARVHVTHEAAYLIAKAHLGRLTQYLEELAGYSENDDATEPMNRAYLTQPRAANAPRQRLYPLRLR